MLKINSYTTKSGKNLFNKWFKELGREDKERLTKRLERIKETGNFGDCKHLSDGVFELKFHFDAGYRIYFGKDGKRVIILLCGGDKDSQNQDIKKAINLWQEYQKN